MTKKKYVYQLNEDLRYVAEVKGKNNSRFLNIKFLKHVSNIQFNGIACIFFNNVDFLLLKVIKRSFKTNTLRCETLHNDDYFNFHKGLLCEIQLPCTQIHNIQTLPTRLKVPVLITMNKEGIPCPWRDSPRMP